MQKNWISIHIFYYADQNPLIVHCVAPLVEQLREHDLLQQYFFIKYWAEGPHVRLRLLPKEGADVEKIKSIAEAHITQFLHTYPALYSINHEKMAPFYKKLFLLEYGEDRWIQSYGVDGVMPIRPNNTFDYIPYEPEYERYGGEVGVELAQWHFEHSSDTVANLVREINVGVPGMVLGRSAQLMLTFFYGIFEDDTNVLRALDEYIRSWIRADPKAPSRMKQYAKKYQRMAPALQQRIATIRDFMLGDRLSDSHPERLTKAEENWKNHIQELRVRIKHLHQQGQLVLPLQSQTSTMNSLQATYNYLQSSYVHMTNNRLGIAIPEEIYIAYLLKHTLEDMIDIENTREERIPA